MDFYLNQTLYLIMTFLPNIITFDISKISQRIYFLKMNNIVQSCQQPEILKTIGIGEKQIKNLSIL